MAGVVILGLASCGDRSQPNISKPPLTQEVTKVLEVSPPAVIQELRQALEDYRPQVTILNLRPDEVLQDDTITVKFQVQDLPIFKDKQFGLGPHLHVILDNQPYKAVYDVTQPFVLENLAAGTHTLRVFASRPWHESFKNEGAYAQVKFHVFTRTPENNPEPALPLLTYSRPTGSYGAEPIMLDFYLTNAPLHLIAQESSDDDIADWRIRCTVNGASFTLDRWQPLYLQGFKPGKNWVQLELLDEQGKPINNAFNNTARLITYEPNGGDPLSKLTRNELSVAEARSIVDPNYKPVVPEPETTSAPTPIPAPPTAQPTPPSPVAPSLILPSEPVPTPTVEPTPLPDLEAGEDTTVTEFPATTEPIQTKQPDQPKPGGFFNRFRLPSSTPVTPAPTPTVEPTPLPDLEAGEDATVTESPATTDAEPPTTTEPIQPKQADQPKPSGFFNRFQLPSSNPVVPSPNLPTPLPEIFKTPEPGPAPFKPVAPDLNNLPETESKEPEQPPRDEDLPSESQSAPEVFNIEPPDTQSSKLPKPSGFLNRFRSASPSSIPSSPSLIPSVSPNLPPTLPEIIETPAPESKTSKPEIPQVKNSQEPESAIAPEPSLNPEDEPETSQSISAPAEAKPRGFEPFKQLNPDNLLNRFRRPSPRSIMPTPSLPSLPEVIEVPDLGEATPEEL